MTRQSAELLAAAVLKAAADVLSATVTRAHSGPTYDSDAAIVEARDQLAETIQEVFDEDRTDTQPGA